MADEIKGDLFKEAEFWSNSRVILNMRCNSVKVQESWLAGERNEREHFLEKVWGDWNFWPNVASLVDAKESLKINFGGTGRSA